MVELLKIINLIIIAKKLQYFIPFRFNHDLRYLNSWLLQNDKVNSHKILNIKFNVLNIIYYF